jgi:hypothetical protein
LKVIDRGQIREEEEEEKSKKVSELFLIRILHLWKKLFKDFFLNHSFVNLIMVLIDKLRRVNMVEYSMEYSMV